MFVVNDLLDAIFLGSFFFGLIFSGLSLFLGIANLGFDHIGGHDGHGLPIGHHDANLLHGPDDGLSPISVGTILGFLTWFGGVAYLARNGLGVFGAISFVIGIVAGLVGGFAVFWMLRTVRRHQAGIMRPADDYLPGTIGRVTSSIRAGGTGEIIYERRGVRQVSAARSPGGKSIPRGTEVVIMRHAAGVAEVEPWATLIGDGVDDEHDVLDMTVERNELDMPPPKPIPSPSPDTVRHV